MVTDVNFTDLSFIQYLTRKFVWKFILRNFDLFFFVGKFFLTFSFSKYLTFAEPPEIIARPFNQFARVNNVATFYCEAKGDPQPAITWRKNGKRISSTQSRYTITDLSGASMLRIEPLRSGRDEAPYECAAENNVGSDKAEALLAVYEGEWEIFFVRPFFKLYDETQQKSSPCHS